MVVVVHSADWCEPCRDLKNWLKSQGISFIEKDWTNVEKRPYLMLPVTEVNGKQIIGFQPEAIRRALG